MFLTVSDTVTLPLFAVVTLVITASSLMPYNHSIYLFLLASKSLSLISTGVFVSVCI